MSPPFHQVDAKIYESENDLLARQQLIVIR